MANNSFFSIDYKAVQDINIMMLIPTQIMIIILFKKSYRVYFIPLKHKKFITKLRYYCRGNIKLFVLIVFSLLGMLIQS
ncbi:hypothetical protein SASC598O11_013210 [Snodgrassella alvi SCGC AB-598-O11]|nr:hypothetical protein SASC598O11_013210 [Snodgrassella alvi SCGC AB-598-O11]